MLRATLVVAVTVPEVPVICTVAGLAVTAVEALAERVIT